MAEIVFCSACLVVFILFLILLTVKCDSDGEVTGGAFIGLAIGALAVSLVVNIDKYHHKEKEIPAIEVYRGNTELKVTKTVVNGSIIGCDTTVIFNDNL